MAGIAETARLVASLDLKDNLSRGVGSATASVGRLESRVGGLGTRLGRFSSNLKGGFSSAVSTFSGRVRGAATSIAALTGIGGLFALGRTFADSVSKAREFGEASQQLARITGQNVEQTSRMVDALDFYGIAADKANKIAGMFVKNVGNLKATKKANEFQEKYGLSLKDSTGKLRGFNDQLLASADFYNDKTIPASKKAAALSKLYGRSWQDLLPVLAKGRTGIKKALDDAMHLSEADLKAIQANKQATREWDDALGDLKTRLGIDVLPTLTEVAKTLTGFVQRDGDKIREIFKNGLATAKNFAGQALDVVKGIKGVWDGIPGPVQDMLVKGFIADRTVKFLFGFSIADLAKNLFGGIAKGLGGALVQAGIGKAFVQPVFVTNQIAGVPGGGGAVAGAAKGGLGLISKVFLVGEAIGLAMLVQQVAQGVSDAATEQAEGIHEVLKESLASPQTAEQLKIKLDGINQGIAKLKADPVAAALITGPAIAELEKMRGEVVDAIARSALVASPPELAELRSQKAAIQQARQRQEANAAAAKAAIEQNRVQTVAATRTGDASIVAAIGRNKPVVNLRVSVSQTARVRVYQTGGTLNRTGSGSGPGGPVDPRDLW